MQDYVNLIFQMAAHLNCFFPSVEGKGTLFVSNFQDPPSPVTLTRANARETFFRFVEGSENLRQREKELGFAAGFPGRYGGWDVLEPLHAGVFPLDPRLKVLAAFKEEERRTTVMAAADDTGSSWSLDLIVRPPGDDAGDTSFRHSVAILEGGARLFPEYRLRLSGRKYAASFLQNAKLALGLDPRSNFEREELMKKVRHSPIADYPWSLSWVFDDIPGEGLLVGIRYNPLHRRPEALTPFLESLLQYAQKLLQIPKPG